MRSSKTIFQEMVDAIDLAESREEINSVAYFLATSLFSITKTDILAGKLVPFSDDTAQTLQKCIQRINTGEPVQYVVGEEYFYGRKFHVNPSVLIPRPETEGLIRAVLNYLEGRVSPNPNAPLQLLDIGTGSGCIPVTLFFEVSNAKIFATDVSTAALSVAVNNADVHNAKITFIEHNVLTENLPMTALDVIVSNPPYVTHSERQHMRPNVLDHEPHIALFVPDNDPLLFYRSIAGRAAVALKKGGLLAVEINERFGEDVKRLFRDAGFNSIGELTDVSGKPRVISALK